MSFFCFHNRNAFANSFAVRLRFPTNPPVGQALAFDASQRNAGAVLVADAEANAVVVTEVIFGKVAVRDASRLIA